jgi:hypothetical protein
MISSGKFWDLIKHFDDEGYLLAGGTPGEDMWTESNKKPEEGGEEPEAPKNKGLIPGHAYSVIIAKEANGVKLLNVRNPWGKFEWDGDYGDNSALWTQDMKDAFKPCLDDNDGTFWISFQDFCANFDSLDVCRVRNWDEVRIRGRFIRFADS